MTRVLVTGANGHVGSNTVRSLLRRGYEVVPIIARENMLMQDMGKIITRLTGVKPRHIGAGCWLMSVIASLAELVRKVSGSEFGC